MKLKAWTKSHGVRGAGGFAVRRRLTVGQVVAAAGRPVLVGLLLLLLSLGAAGVVAYVTTGEGALSWWNQVRAAELSPSSMVKPGVPADA